MNSANATINILNIPFGESKITREEFYPCLAYIDHLGNADGVMFKSFCFDLSRCGETLSRWEKAIELMFGSENSLFALNDAAKDIKTLLNLKPETTFDVYIKAPIPRVSLTPFGDINGDGITEKLLDAEDCVQAFSLFVSRLTRHFEISWLKNLKIKGWVLEGNGEIRTKCAELLAEKGFSVYGNEAEFLNLSRDTDFSRIICDKAPIHIFNAVEEGFVVNCALAQDENLRKVYDSLYILLNAKLLGKAEIPEETDPVSEVDEINETVEELAVEETFEETDDRNFDITFDEFPEELEESDEIGELKKLDGIENIEEIEEIEEIEDIPEDFEYDLQELAKLEPEREVATKEPIADEKQNKISVEISITEEKIPEETVKTIPCEKSKKLSKKQKSALLGAGIAVAALGIAYLFGKGKKD